MVAQTPTLLPLYRFAQVLGLHPLHFMQVDANIGSAASRVCIEPIFQYTWQHSDAISREELALAIYEAEYQLAEVLGYWPLPQWQVQERVPVLQAYGGFATSLRNILGDLISVRTRYGYVISGGRRIKTVITAAQGVAYTDADGDGYSETATIGPVVTTVTDPEQIAIYYPGQAGADEWEILPVTVTISGGAATIVCRREQLVVKNQLEALDAQTLNGGTAANFLTTVDVYRKYNDPSKQVELVWRNFDDCSTCNGDGCVTCGLVIQNGCMTVKDDRLGIVTVAPGEWNATDEAFDSAEPDVCRRPDYVRLWYRSGYRDLSSSIPNIKMAREWEIAIAKLAVTKLDRPICSCRSVQQIQERWSIDLRASTATQPRSVGYKLTQYEMENNPFGTTVGAMDVWRLVRRQRLGTV